MPEDLHVLDNGQVNFLHPARAAEGEEGGDNRDGVAQPARAGRQGVPSDAEGVVQHADELPERNWRRGGSGF